MIIRKQTLAERAPGKQNLWLRWLIANALGEMFGLGLTFVIGAFVISRLSGQTSTSTILASFGIAIVSGAVEATIVGFSQWWAMHPWFSTITRRSWWSATFVGALIAYVLGYLPSTLIDLGEAASQAQPTAVEPPLWLVLLLAAGLGVVGGAMLSFAQYLVLRKTVKGAGIWIPANMLAWLFGMPVIFWGIDAATKGQPIFQSVLLMAVVLLAAGAVVGAVHGIFLVNLVDKRTE